ncbi:MAG: biotin-dependent carboxyltransferase [Allomuricauda sp.]|nr:MAG: biotin-dependent carboxyltransferase [Allomuricauda sp.]
MFKILKPGFFTSVQDQGRFGYRDKGVPVSGAMDAISASRANRLLENDPRSALLEITMTGPEIEFEAHTCICLSGAKFSAKVNEEPIGNDKVIRIQKGDKLSFGKLEQGFRAYLGIKGGVQEETVLGSKSFYFPLTKRSSLKAHTEIDFEPSDFVPKISEMKIEGFLSSKIIEVQKGPEFDLLNQSQLTQLFAEPFTVSKENNRMAYQLNEYLDGHTMKMLTSATLPGTVQLTPAGRLIILMKDGQTTGGYPRILQLTNTSICVLAQKKFGDTIKFKWA